MGKIVGPKDWDLNTPKLTGQSSFFQGGFVKSPLIIDRFPANHRIHHVICTKKRPSVGNFWVPHFPYQNGHLYWEKTASAATRFHSASTKVPSDRGNPGSALHS